MKSLTRQFLRVICRCYPLYSGRGTIANSKIFRSLSETKSSPEITTTLHDGSSIVVPLDDYIGRSIYYFGDLDYKISWVCKNVLRPGDCVVDIGAHFGLVTLFASAIVGPKGSVHSFEPHPKFADRIQRSLTLNQRRNVSLHNVALTDEPGEMTLHVPFDNSGRASLIKPNRPLYEVQIKAVNTTDYFGQLDLNSIRLLKIDVEGHEEDVFRGGEGFLRTNKPDVILFEEHKKPIREQPVVSFLHDLGYQILAIPRANLFMSTFPLNGTDRKSCTASHDYVAVNKQATDAGEIRSKLNARA